MLYTVVQVVPGQAGGGNFKFETPIAYRAEQEQCLPVFCRHSDFQTFKFSDIQTFRHPDVQTFRLSDIETFRRLSSFQTSKLSDIQTFRPSNFQTAKLSDFQTFKHNRTTRNGVRNCSSKTGFRRQTKKK